MSWYWWVLFIVGFLVTACGSYVGYVYLLAKTEVAATPKEDAFWCPKHGACKKSSCITIMGNVTLCPRCFEEKLRAAKEMMA